MKEKPKLNKRQRRERAEQRRAAICDTSGHKKGSEDDSSEESVPLVRSKPHRVKKKTKEPLFEENILDGFAMLSFKTYEDLEVRLL